MTWNVLYCSDNNYAPYLGISMLSLLENNRDAESIVFYVVSDGISDDNIARLKKQVARYGETRRIVTVNGEDWIKRLKDMNMLPYRGGHAANLRLFFTEYIEKDVERILYLDCDTIICGSLDELFNTPMGESPAAVILDSLSANYKKLIGFASSDSYFNSGVILFDVKNWIDGGYRESLVDMVRQTDLVFINPDQDILNIVLKDKKYILSPKYNFQTTHRIYSDKVYFANYSGKDITVRKK